MIKTLIQILIALLIVGIGFLVFKNADSDEKKSKKGQAKAFVQSVSAKEVKKGDHYPLIKASGRVYSEQIVSVTPEVSGLIKVSGFHFKTGSFVKKGALLFKIDDRIARSQFKMAVGDLLSQLSTVLPELKTNLPEVYEKWKSFFEQLSLSQLPVLPILEGTKEKLFISRFKVLKQYYTAENKWILLQRHFIYSPVNGTVQKSVIQAGVRVNAGREVGVLLRTDKIEMEVPISSKEIEWIDSKQEVIITLRNRSQSYKGRVVRIAKSITEETQTASVFIALKIPKKGYDYLHGNYGEAVFRSKKIPHVFSLPRSALRHPHRVLTIQKGKIKVKEVSIKKFGIDSVYIGEGIEEGEMVVIETVPTLFQGAKVKAILQE